jgi:hypothetical protein
MYFLETGLGEVFKPRPKSPPPKPPPKALANQPPKEGKVVKDGHWRFCGGPYQGSVSCDLNLKVRFRRSFDEFLREVETAYGRWMARPTAQMLVKKLQNDLKQWHQDMLSQKLLDNDPINFVAGLYYRRSNGTWLVDGSSLRQWWRLIDI